MPIFFEIERMVGSGQLCREIAQEGIDPPGGGQGQAVWPAPGDDSHLVGLHAQSPERLQAVRHPLA